MKLFFRILGAFGWYIAEKPFPFLLNGQPLTDFPDSVDKFIDYIIFVVFPRKTYRVLALIPGKGDVSIDTPEKLRAYLGQDRVINMVGF